VGLKVVRDSPARDVEGIVGRPSGMDKVTFEDDRLVAGPRDGERSCESRDAAPGDDELHRCKLTGRRSSPQAALTDCGAKTERCSSDPTSGPSSSVRSSKLALACWRGRLVQPMPPRRDRQAQLTQPSAGLSKRAAYAAQLGRRGRMWFAGERRPPPPDRRFAASSSSRCLSSLSPTS
jgi:hypothetical protein